MSLDPLRFVRPDFASLDAYTPVKPLDVLAAEIGVPIDQLVKLDANENLYGPIAEVVEAAARAPLHIYPDPGQHALRAAIADYLGVTADEVVAGAGSDDLLDILLRLVMPETIVSCPPTFGMYAFLAKIGRARVVEVPRGEGFALDLAAIAAAVAAGARMVFLASPNNPTGNPLTATEAETVAALEALVVIDEAYTEFAGQSHVGLVRRHPNVVVVRTFSKWAGLAGLRVGYSVSHPELARRMMAIKQPYNVNVAADAAACAALRHRELILPSVRALVAERERLTREVAGLGWLEPLPSQANFVLFRVHGRDARAVVLALRKRAVLVRQYDRPELSGYIRISAGRPADTDRLMEALRTL